MKIRPLVFIFIVLIAAMVMSRQGVGQSAVAGTQNAAAAQNAAVVPQNVSAVRFLTPQPGEKLQQSAVTVRYAIDQPQVVAASTPKKPQPQTEPPQASLSQPELISASVEIVPRATFSGQSGNGPSGAPENGRLAQDGNLPEAASALPLLSIIGAGMLIGGLLSARKTRSMKT
jgi:hypothetical protein